MAVISRTSIVRAAGVFITSTVVFAALIVIASGLGFSDQAERFLPTVERALPGDAPGEIVFEDGSATVPASDIGRPFEVPGSTVTAEPATPEELAAAPSYDTNAVSVAVPARPDSETQQRTSASRGRQIPRSRSPSTSAPSTPAPSTPGTPSPSPQQAPAPSPTPSPQSSPPSTDGASPSPPASETPSFAPSEGETRFEEPPEQWSEPASPSSEPAPQPALSPEPSASPTAVDHETEFASEAAALP